MITDFEVLFFYREDGWWDKAKVFPAVSFFDIEYSYEYHLL